MAGKYYKPDHNKQSLESIDDSYENGSDLFVQRSPQDKSRAIVKPIMRKIGTAGYKGPLHYHNNRSRYDQSNP